MSSKAKKMQNQALAFQEQPAPKTRSVTVRLGLTIYQGDNETRRSTFMQLDGIPAELPESMEAPVIKSAERQFVRALNQRMYLETYTPDGSSKSEHPVFFNLMHVDGIGVDSVAKVTEDEEKKEN